MKKWMEIIALTGDYLAKNSVPDAQTAAELLAARLLKCGRGFLVSFAEKEVPEKMLEAMRRAMARLVKGEPLQYVLGEWDFRTLTLKCDRRALIPRPETEELVERVLKHLKARGDASAPLVVDVGTGTGCITLSLAKESANGIFLGTDISPEAVALARENAELCGLSSKAKFAVADGLDDFDPESVDVIVSNPPYVTTAECDALDPRVKDFEPRTALDGGVSGLDFYERYISDAVAVLKPGGAVFFEIGESQGDAVRRLLTEWGFNGIKIEKDMSGHDRFASGLL
jgi:release factor glutamine methyltransferase